MAPKRLLLLASLVAVAGFMSACSGSSGQPASPAVLAVLGQTGGMCVDGGCEREVTVYSDGSTSEAGRTINPKKLAAAVEASKLNELPEDPEAFCQSFVDGTDLTVSVPQWGATTYTVCRLKGGQADPLAVEAEAVLATVWR